jgi:hypothetical protein
MDAMSASSPHEFFGIRTRIIPRVFGAHRRKNGRIESRKGILRGYNFLGENYIP